MTVGTSWSELALGDIYHMCVAVNDSCTVQQHSLALPDSALPSSEPATQPSPSPGAPQLWPAAEHLAG